MTELEAYKELISYSFGVNLNLNDTFDYAASDEEDLFPSEIKFLIPFIQRYGGVAIIAFIALKRGYDPHVKSVLVTNFYEAKKELGQALTKKAKG